jgi:Tfp pilus assembly protein PilF
MGFRFRRSIKLAPGVRLNLGAKSMGISAGRRGMRVGFNTRTGAYTSVGIPGTGLSYRSSLGSPAPRTSHSATPAGPVALPQETAEPTNPFLTPAPAKAVWSLGCLSMVLAAFALCLHPVVSVLVLVAGFFVGYLVDLSHEDTYRHVEAANRRAQRAWEAILAQRPETAIADLEALRAAFPDNALLLHQLVLARAKTDLQDARELLDQWLQRYPTDVEALLLLGALCRDQDDLKGALAAYRTAAATAPDDATRAVAILHQSTIVLDSGRPDQAYELLRTLDLRHQFPTDVLVALRYWRGLCQLRLGHKAQARQEWTRAAALDPTYEGLAEKLAEIDAGDA